VVGPIAAGLAQAGRERGAGIVDLGADPQARVPGLVPTDPPVGRHPGLERIEQLIGSGPGLASLEIDNAHRHSLQSRGLRPGPPRATLGARILREPAARSGPPRGARAETAPTAWPTPSPGWTQ